MVTVVGNWSIITGMEHPKKTVGRRVVPGIHTPSDAAALQDAMAEMFEGRPICARGVYRFRTFQEAERWLMKQMAKNSLAHQRKQT